MSFAWPFALVLLLLIPLGAFAYRRIGRRRARRAEGLARRQRARPAAAGRGCGRSLPGALFVLALVAMVVALARPQGTVALPISQGTRDPRVRRLGEHGGD